MSDGKFEIKRLTEPELKELALSIMDGHVFSSLHYMQMHDDSLEGLEMVFMPLVLMAKELKPIANEIGMLYEELKNASPRSVNGMPIFLSMKMIHKDQMVQLHKYMLRLLKQREAFLEESNDD